MIRKRRHTVDPNTEQITEPLSDQSEGQPEDEQHDPEKHRDRQIFVRQHAVDLHTALMFSALLTLCYRFRAYFFNKSIAHIRKCRIPVHMMVCLHLLDAVLHHVQLVLTEFQTFYDIGIVLYDLDCCKTR